MPRTNEQKQQGGEERRKLTVVMPAEVHERLVALAEQERRHMSAQALVFIEAGLAERERTSAA